MKKKSKIINSILTVILSLLSLTFVMPILIILINSFKGRFYISDQPFSLPNAETFSGITNYINGVQKTGFINAFIYSLIITVFSVGLIVIFTSMTGWYLARIKNKFTKTIYYLFVFSMIVPFQMVMFTMSKISDTLKLGNPWGIVLLYLGFGAGMSVFMFFGFAKSIPIEVEEAALMDNCNPLQMFFLIVFPMMKPISITVAILNTMWIWNDYLLPYLVLDSKYKTLPIAVQYLQGGYGSKDMGAMMAMLILTIIPIIIFYLTCQKYIIKGVTAGAVKG